MSKSSSNQLVHRRQRNLAFASGCLSMIAFALALVNKYGAWSLFFTPTAAPLTWLYHAMFFVAGYRRKQAQSYSHSLASSYKYPPNATIFGLVIGTFLTVVWLVDLGISMRNLAVVKGNFFPTRTVECLVVAAEAGVSAAHVWFCWQVRRMCDGEARWSVVVENSNG